MNKYLLLSAAAVFAAVTPSEAATHGAPSGYDSVYITNGSGFAYCNRWYLGHSGKLDANYQSFAPCGYEGWTGFGIALGGKSKTLGRYFEAPNDILQRFEGLFLASDFLFSLPLTNGGTYVAYTSDGSSTYEIAIGHYFIGTSGKTSGKLLKKPVQEMLLHYAVRHGRKLTAQRAGSSSGN